MPSLFAIIFRFFSIFCFSLGSWFYKIPSLISNTIIQHQNDLASFFYARRVVFLFYQKYAKTCAGRVYDVPFKIVGVVTLIVVEPAVQ